MVDNKTIDEAKQTIAELTNEWIQILTDPDNSPDMREEKALKFYCTAIMPILLPVLQEEFTEKYNQSPKYDGLISLLGFAPDTVILASNFTQPDTLVVIHTEETEKYLQVVCQNCGVKFPNFFHESFVESPNTDIYRALEAALKRFPRGSKVAIELTGGKKTMSGALAIAAGLLDIELLYIDYLNYMPQFRKPRPESTYIQLVGNPLKLPVDLFAEVDMERSVNFFNAGRYDISEALFSQASQRMAKSRSAEICADLSKVYMLWNSFNFQEALRLSQPLFEKVLQFIAEVTAILHFDLESFRKQIKTLELLADGCRKSLLLNFYFSAERYQKNNQGDIAALLYYRTLESTFENSLKDLAENFDTENPDYSLFKENLDSLVKKISSYKGQAFRNSELNSVDELPSTLAMIDSLCLLGALDQEITQRITLKRVANMAVIRNRSVYAHGIRPIDSKSVNDICKLATDALSAYLEIKEFDSIDSHRGDFEFIELAVRRDV